MSDTVNFPRVLWLTAALVLCAAAVALFSVARGTISQFVSQERVEPTEPIVPLPHDLAAIIEAVLEHANFGGSPLQPEAPYGRSPSRQQVVLSDEAVIVCAGSNFESAVLDCPSVIDDAILAWPGADFRIPRAMRVQLGMANRTSAHIPRISGQLVIHASQAEIEAAIGTGGRVWKRFQNTYPGAGGFVKFSQAVLSEDQTWAVILVEHYCGGLCGSGQVYLLMRGDAGWSVVVTDVLWIS